MVALGYLAVLLLVPVGLIFYRTFEKGLGAFIDSITTPAAIHALFLTLEVAAIAVPLNAVFGVLAALALVRGRIPGKRVLDALIDLPFAISPVVVGLSLLLVFGRTGWFGPWLADHGIQIIFSLPGIVIATLFVTLPFVAREVAPVLQEIGDEQEQAAATLGAGRGRRSGASRCPPSAGASPTASCSRPRGRSASSARSASSRARSRARPRR